MAQNKKKKPLSKTGGDTNTISITGNQNAVATGGGRASVTHLEETGLSNFSAWRKQIGREVGRLKGVSEEDKSILKQNIEQIAREAEKGTQADASRLERLINTLSAMAPDILDVAIATLSNPLAGIGLAVKKIGDKARVTQKL
jgi:hypothetical protein